MKKRLALLLAVVMMMVPVLSACGGGGNKDAGSSNAPATEEKKEETYRIHTVVKGDTLWDIAAKYLGNGARYPEIKTLNELKSNTIYSGWKLKIPN